MATDRSVAFGRVVERGRSNRIWFAIIPAVIALLALVGFGMASLGQADSVRRDLQAANARADEAQKAVGERDRMLIRAREDADLLGSTGQAAAVFTGVAPGATESGLVMAHPAQHAAAVFLWGLAAPAGRQYQLAARGADGALTALGPVLPSDQGTGFLLARNVPDGASAVVLVATPAGKEGLADAEPRVSARYPATKDDRGILAQQQAQGRRARR